jgi:Mg-chelatase subunit ChlD
MSNQLTNPVAVAAAIARAAQRKGEPDEVERWKRRLEHAGAATVLVCDCSGSMSELARGDKLRIDLLREAVRELGGLADHMIAFASHAKLTQELPEPGGWTRLDLALDLTATLKPSRTIVISDGVPDSSEDLDDQASALASAERLPGRIDVVYCGPEHETAAIAFMRRLARVGGGTMEFCDWNRRQIAPTIRALLERPKP